MRQNSDEEKKRFKEMCMLEPSLADLRSKAVSLLQDEHVPDFWERYGQIKSELQQYVGWKSKQNLLRTTKAYDIATREVFIGLV